MIKLAVGIDMSKAKFDVCIFFEDGRRLFNKFKNDAQGFNELLKWVEAHGELISCHFCMESTGVYSFGLAAFLADAGLLVSVVNPRCILHFREVKRMQNKTDKRDASLIASFCKQEEPRAWNLANATRRELSVLLRRVDQIENMIRMERNHLEANYGFESYTRSVQDNIDNLRTDAKLVKKQIVALVNQDPELKAQIEAVDDLKGAGFKWAVNFVVEIGELSSYESAQAAAAYFGLNPRLRESGTMKGRSTISKAGNARLRAMGFMCTLSAIRHNPIIKAFYTKLLARGKPKKQALIACTRKFVMMSFGIANAQRLGQKLYNCAGSP